jgi:hypothetical protein
MAAMTAATMTPSPAPARQLRVKTDRGRLFAQPIQAPTNASTETM